MHLWFLQPHAYCFGCVDIHYEGKWVGIGPWNLRVFWALWNYIKLIGECHLGPEKLENSRAQSPPTCPRNGYAAYAQGCINHRCIGGFMHKRPRGRFQGPYWGGWRSRCITELVRPARVAPPPITKLIRNQETTVRYIICASAAQKRYYYSKKTARVVT